MLLVLVGPGVDGQAQNAAQSGSEFQGVPRVIPASGRVVDAAGQALAGRVWITFHVYAAADAVDPLWTDSGWVELDAAGSFSVVLGANSQTGVPAELFAAGEARWLGYAARGLTEGPRTRILSVPYALKALDAATLGGRPASDYVLASELGVQAHGGATAAAQGPNDKSIKGLGTVDRLAKFLAVDTIGDSAIIDVGGNVGIGTATPGYRLDVLNNAAAAYTASFRNTSTGPGAGGAYGEGTKWGLTGIGTGTGSTSIGVWGAVTADPGGLGVFGWHNVTSGAGSGVRGTTTSPAGTGLLGDALATTGAPIGVRGVVLSPTGIAGQFDSDAGGTILQGRASGVEKFRIDALGNLFANALFDLSGTPVGLGTVTSVGAGTGLTGGPISSSGTLSLDTAFTDARYAAAAHGHLVGDVVGAATLGANAFTGNQTVTGNIGSTGEVSGRTGVFSNNTTGSALSVQQSGANNALHAETTSSGYSAVFGRNTSGAGSGLRGEAGAHGVVGLATTTAGTDVNGVLGWATGASGSNAGVRGRSDSPAGIGGIFENSTGGTLIQGRVGFTEKFRVDGTGNVFANGLFNLSGQPLGTGTVTSVASGTGLTGGPISSSGTLSLDTAFTDTRYAAAAHGHLVGDVVGAATLGANAFTGNQTIGGTLNLGGFLTAAQGTFTASTGGNTLMVHQNGAGNAVAGRSDAGIGVVGEGKTGVNSISNDGNGIALRGWVAHATGLTRGLFVQVDSPNGIGGEFENTAGGRLLRGTVGGVERFKVDGTGTVFASSYRDLAGNPIASGTVTSIATGTGLTGGPITGTGTIGLDVTFTDARYAAAAHGHTVGEVSNAASVFANTFLAKQTIEAPSAGTQALFARNTSGQAVQAEGSTYGLTGVATGAVGTGVYAWSTTTTGAAYGMYADVASPNATAVTGHNKAGGKIFSGRTGPLGNEVFRIDGSGNLFANGLFNLSGAPLGTGTVTSVASGTGLTGGPISSSGTLSLDTTFTDARYAAAVHGHTVGQVAGAATLGANTFAGTQTIDAGNLDLDASTATTGNISKDGVRFLHNYGGGTYLGSNAGSFSSTGNGNTGVGDSALRFLTSGSGNTAVGISALNSTGIGSSNVAVGFSAMSNNTSGGSNVAIGAVAMQNNSTGSLNTAAGQGALRANTTASSNTAFGFNALEVNTTGVSNTAVGRSALGVSNGSSNVAVGNGAGANATTGSNNIYLGADVAGVAGESNTMYLGKVGTQTTTVIAGVRGTAVTGGEVVFVDAAGRLGSGALPPSSASDLTCTGCVDASEVSFSFAAAVHGHTVGEVAGAATLNANTFTGTQTLNGANLELGMSSATTGNVTKGGVRFLHNTAGGTFVGSSAGNLSSTSIQNTGIGSAALSAVSSGNNNTAVGTGALQQTTSGSLNVAVGTSALTSNSTGGNNTALGMNALLFHPNGSSNTAVGRNALVSLTSGDSNAVLGAFAGQSLTTGSGNLYLANQGVASESSTIRIGQGHTTAFIAGVRGVTTGSADAIPVMIDSTGQLGTVSSSRRFKEDIRDMANASNRLLQLRPVTFRYTETFANGFKPVQFGLIAEEVAEVFPELAVRNASGGVDTVHYETLNVLLLNELQKQHQRIAELERKLNELLAARPASGR
jgi:hypothetical protein